MVSRWQRRGEVGGGDGGEYGGRGAVGKVRRHEYKNGGGAA